MTSHSRTHMKNMFQKQQMEQEEQRRIDLSIESPASSLDSSDGIHSQHTVNSYAQGWNNIWGVMTIPGLSTWNSIYRDTTYSKS